MTRSATAVTLRLDFGEVVPGRGAGGQRNLRLASAAGVLRGPDKYRALDLKRRRAQIRARRALELTD